MFSAVDFFESGSKDEDWRNKPLEITWMHLKVIHVCAYMTLYAISFTAE